MCVVTVLGRIARGKEEARSDAVERKREKQGRGKDNRDKKVNNGAERDKRNMWKHLRNV